MNVTNASTLSSEKLCDAPGCILEGIHRAPKSRDQLTDYYWFCLTHVRTYNLKWNYYAGLPSEEIERLNVDDLGGRRPTWPMGQWASKSVHYVEQLKEALHTTFKMDPIFDSTTEKLSRPVTEAAKILGLSIPFTSKEVKANYRKLVKQFHPDRHMTSFKNKKAAEEMFKKVTAAYETLKKYIN